MLTNATSETQRCARLSSALGLFEALTDAVVVCNHAGEIIDLNPAAETFFGYPLHEVSGEPVTTLLSMTGLEQIRAEARPALEHDDRWQGEVVVQIKDGSRRIVNALVVNVAADGDGRPPLRVVISRDITDQRRTEQCARESETRFRSMADAAPVLIWQTGTNGLNDYFNRPWLDFTGRLLQHELGNGWTERVHPEDIKRCRQSRTQAFGTREAFQAIYRLKRHDGQYRWILDNGTPRYAPNGNFEGYIGTCVDITEHKELEDALRVRTEELTLASQRKDEFLAMLSHELRNPLAPIANSLAVMRTFEIDDPLMVRSRAIIERQVDHLTDLVNDLLDVARITSGKINVTMETISLDSVIERAVEISHPKIMMSAHALTVTRPSAPVYLKGDLMRLAQALSNILSNAAKFTAESGLITLDAGQKDGLAFVSVRDNGRGMSKEFQPRLFELFAQADESLARTQSGLGIGLAIAHQIVSLHGGTIKATSGGLGCGSTFTLYLPTATAASRAPQVETPATTAFTANQDFRILLIDDNHDANESMGSLLKLLDYNVRTASNAESGLGIAVEFEPHLILSDIGLPDMDGYQLAPALRKAAGGRKMVLAAATGYGLANDRMRSRAAGFDYHLVKPLDADSLLSFVAQQVASY